MGLEKRRTGEKQDKRNRHWVQEKRGSEETGYRRNMGLEKRGTGEAYGTGETWERRNMGLEKRGTVETYGT